MASAVERISSREGGYRHRHRHQHRGLRTDLRVFPPTPAMSIELKGVAFSGAAIVIIHGLFAVAAIIFQ